MTHQMDLADLSSQVDSFCGYIRSEHTASVSDNFPSLQSPHHWLAPLLSKPLEDEPDSDPFSKLETLAEVLRSFLVHAQKGKRPLVVGVFGVFNAGKSRLINLLLELDIQTVSSEPQTESIHILFEEQDRQFISPFTILAKNLHKERTVVADCCSTDKLPGIILLDTPGVSAEGHKRLMELRELEKLSRTMIPLCDVVLVTMPLANAFTSNDVPLFEILWKDLCELPFYLVLSRGDNENGIREDNGVWHVSPEIERKLSGISKRIYDSCRDRSGKWPYSVEEIRKRMVVTAIPESASTERETYGINDLRNRLNEEALKLAATRSAQVHSHKHDYFYQMASSLCGIISDRVRKQRATAERELSNTNLHIRATREESWFLKANEDLLVRLKSLPLLISHQLQMASLNVERPFVHSASAGREKAAHSRNQLLQETRAAVTGLWEQIQNRWGKHADAWRQDAIQRVSKVEEAMLLHLTSREIDWCVLQPDQPGLLSFRRVFREIVTGSLIEPIIRRFALDLNDSVNQSEDALREREERLSQVNDCFFSGRLRFVWAEGRREISKDLKNWWNYYQFVCRTICDYRADKDFDHWPGIRKAMLVRLPNYEDQSCAFSEAKRNQIEEMVAAGLLRTSEADLLFARMQEGNMEREAAAAAGASPARQTALRQLQKENSELCESVASSTMAQITETLDTELFRVEGELAPLRNRFQTLAKMRFDQALLRIQSYWWGSAAILTALLVIVPFVLMVTGIPFFWGLILWGLLSVAGGIGAAKLLIAGSELGSPLIEDWARLQTWKVFSRRWRLTDKGTDKLREASRSALFEYVEQVHARLANCGQTALELVHRRAEQLLDSRSVVQTLMASEQWTERTISLEKMIQRSPVDADVAGKQAVQLLETGRVTARDTFEEVRQMVVRDAEDFVADISRDWALMATAIEQKQIPPNTRTAHRT
ncbi:MAG: GTPase domain-containing protein [Planctomycetaceae bacterium]|nr:GTPase domain-containing protein [Planctomycetaceae bacterium]